VAVASLYGLHEAGVAIDLVVTGVDKRRSRGMALTPCPVKVAAQDLGLTVTHDLDDVVACVEALPGTVLGVVVAYGRILPPSILEVMPLVNLHFSLLPRWRGAAPVERAILEGDSETGVCLMQVRGELDAGEVYDCQRVLIGDDDTLEDVREALNRAGVNMLVDRCLQGFGVPTPQVGQPSYAKKITSEDVRLEWDTSERVSRQVRVGGAFGSINGQRLKVHECRRANLEPDSARRQRGETFAVANRVYVKCTDGAVELVEVQPEGRSRMPARSWWNGLRGADSIAFAT
jgi:methionyl-tRNA formyltransferase